MSTWLKLGRSPFRFSLRLLLVAVTVGCVWLGFRVNEAQHEAAARKTLQPVARHVRYHFEADRDGRDKTNAPAKFKEWVGRQLGDPEYFYRLETVMFSFDVTDADIATVVGPLSKTNIVFLSFAPCREFSDEGLKCVSTLRHLRRLDIRETAVTNGGLSCLTALTNLEDLQLGDKEPGRSENAVDDNGLAIVSSLPALTSLTLWGEGFTDDGLRHLKSVPHLTRLWLQDTNVSPQAMGLIKHLTSLEVLSLSGCDLGDDELVAVLEMPRLKTLCLYSPFVTDASIDIIKQLHDLKYLSISKTSISPGGIAELQKAMPTCSIK